MLAKAVRNLVFGPHLGPAHDNRIICSFERMPRRWRQPWNDGEKRACVCAGTGREVSKDMSSRDTHTREEPCWNERNFAGVCPSAGQDRFAKEVKKNTGWKCQSLSAAKHRHLGYFIFDLAQSQSLDCLSRDASAVSYSSKVRQSHVFCHSQPMPKIFHCHDQPMPKVWKLENTDSADGHSLWSTAVNCGHFAAFQVLLSCSWFAIWLPTSCLSHLVLKNI